MHVTDDAHFEPHVAAPAYENGFPCVRGVIRVMVAKPMDRQVARHLADSRDGKAGTELLLIGRSGHAQVGIDILVDQGRSIAFEGGQLTIPVVISALGPIREPWLQSIIELSKAGRNVRVGRVLLIDWRKKLDRQATLQRMEQNYIAAADNYKVNADGSLSIPIEATEFVSDTSAFGDPEIRQQVLIHSRSALVGHQDTRPLGPVRRRHRAAAPSFMLTSARIFAASEPWMRAMSS